LNVLTFAAMLVVSSKPTHHFLSLETLKHLVDVWHKTKMIFSHKGCQVKGEGQRCECWRVSNHLAAISCWWRVILSHLQKLLFSSTAHPTMLCRSADSLQVHTLQ